MESLINSTISTPTKHIASAMPSFNSPIVLISFFIVFWFWYEIRRKALRIPSFKGPPGLPVIGNLYDIKDSAAERYRTWVPQYGDVFQIQIGDLPALIVNSAAAARKIFLNRSLALSSRPQSYTFYKIVSYTAGHAMSTALYGEMFNHGRKTTAAELSRPAVKNYVAFLDIETHDFIQQCFRLGEAGRTAIDPLRLFQRMTLSMDLTLCWGRRISLEDPLLHDLIFGETEIARLRNPTTNWQDCVPFLRWNPFSPMTKKAYALRKLRDTYFATLNSELDQSISHGTNKACIRADLLAREDVSMEETRLISLTFLSAGTTPTDATMAWIVAFLSRRPDIQATAFFAIQEYYGTDKGIANAEDDQGCLYMAALVKETLRYFSTTRTSLPRSTTKSFEYEGKLVPIGTTIYLNIWACNHDPELWPDADVFDPYRWINRPEAPLFTYGLGFRACAGIALSNRLMYLALVRLIQAFVIWPGSEVDLDPITGTKDDETMVSYPGRYTVSFVPRDFKCLEAIFLEKKE